MKNEKENRHLQKITSASSAIAHSIDDWAYATVPQSLKRAGDIMRDKKRAVGSFFTFAEKEPDEVTTGDVRGWHQKLLEKKHSENYIYTLLSHLSGYFEWLRSLPEFSHFIKSNPVRTVMPKAPKKYNSPKAKSLTDAELTTLWMYLENLANDDKNFVAVRDYTIFRLFLATGMRREEILALGAGDIKIEPEAILIHTRVKGGIYEWRTIADEEVKAALERYLSIVRRKSVIGQAHRALWIRFDRGARIAAADHRENGPAGDEPRLSSHSFDKQIKRYAELAGIGKINIHQFRHTFARIVAEETGSLIETQDALGHKDIQTTQVYVSRIKFKKDKFSRIVRRRVQPPSENQ